MKILSLRNMIRQARIDWSGFIKLRNEESTCIEAAMCRHCKHIMHTITEKRLQNHRYMTNNFIYYNFDRRMILYTNFMIENLAKD